MDDVLKFRYAAVGGIEYKKYHSTYWLRVTPEMMMGMTSTQLREIADAMEAPVVI